MRVALYVRVSTDRQVTEGMSIHDQINQLRNWAKNNEHVIAQEFVELGASAYDDRRPVFDEMIHTATTYTHPYDAIVVHSMTRFYRDNAVRELVERKLEKHSVKVISITEPLPADEAAAKLMRNVVGIMGEWQSRENAKHVIRCQRDNAMQGYYNGAPKPFGYTTITVDVPARSGLKKKLAINNEEAEVVRTIFELASDGLDGKVMGVKKIATYLNDKGLTRRGKKWRHQAIANILNNRVYFGQYISFRRIAKSNTIRPESEWIISKVPEIINEETFKKAAQALESRNITKRESKAIQSPSLLTGLLKCDSCGGNLNVMTGKSGQYHYYYCATKRYSSVNACRCPNIPKEELENLVLSTIAREVLNPERLAKILSDLHSAMKKSAEPDLKRLQAAQRAAALQTERISALYEQISSGLLKLEDSLKEHIQDQQKKLASLKSDIEYLSRRQQLPLKKFGQQQIEDFGIAAQEALLSPNSPLAKGYLKAIVSEIRIGQTEAKIRGNRAQLAGAISAWKPGAIPVVPSLVSNWCARRESNPRPSASEAKILLRMYIVLILHSMVLFCANVIYTIS